MTVKKYVRVVTPRSPRDSILCGIARVVDPLGTKYKTRDLDDPDADMKALASDWKAVGNDIKNVMRRNKATQRFNQV